MLPHKLPQNVRFNCQESAESPQNNTPTPSPPPKRKPRQYQQKTPEKLKPNSTRCVPATRKPEPVPNTPRATAEPGSTYPRDDPPKAALPQLVQKAWIKTQCNVIYTSPINTTLRNSRDSTKKLSRSPGHEKSQPPADRKQEKL